MGCGVSVLFKEPLSLELSGDTNVLAFGEILHVIEMILQFLVWAPVC